MPTCINLRERFGKQFRIQYEESYRAERPEFRREEEPWLQIIPCQYGHLYPHGGELLGFASDKAGSIAKRVARLPFVTITQDGSDGINATFPVGHFCEVAAIVKPKRRRPKRVLTSDQRQALIDRLAQYRFSPQVKLASEGLGLAQAASDDLGAQINSGAVEGHLRGTLAAARSLDI